MVLKITTQFSQILPIYRSLEDNKELQISKSNGSSKRMNEDELPLVPVALTFWSLPDRNSNVEQHLSEIKGLPHNPKSATRPEHVVIVIDGN
ncbi:hypothetical protein MTR_8g015800 [Medicago truncatula]|uniref:Uncharacterized protein n=1 Tax=Medicago truncatula TaxID=3880 RepID=A0A072TLC4_MEDTR|nr:hypothetical protein MTR_8g015800 [Medicago truncatula]